MEKDEKVKMYVVKRSATITMMIRVEATSADHATAVAGEIEMVDDVTSSLGEHNMESYYCGTGWVLDEPFTLRRHIGGVTPELMPIIGASEYIDPDDEE